jgi:glucose 1-dehydrogenase
MSEDSLDGKVALVTGASKGIGRACAVALAAAGARVVVNYRSDEAGAREAADAIGSAGGAATVFQADVGEEDEVRALFAHAEAAFGALDLLVNNAGIQRDAALTEMSLEDWQAVIGTNLQGQFLCAREAARAFCRKPSAGARGAVGNIVFVSSVHDLIPWAGHANYAASKGGALMLMKTVAQELGARKIRVNAVCPGAIRTEINRDAWETEEGRRDILSKVPYGRIGEPEDVARAVVWLASAASDYVHGHALYIDGGMTLYPAFREGG